MLERPALVEAGSQHLLRIAYFAGDTVMHTALDARITDIPLKERAAGRHIANYINSRHFNHMNIDRANIVYVEPLVRAYARLRIPPSISKSRERPAESIAITPSFPLLQAMHVLLAADYSEPGRLRADRLELVNTTALLTRERRIAQRSIDILSHVGYVNPPKLPSDIQNLVQFYWRPTTIE
jgi:hypothetical protein